MPLTWCADPPMSGHYCEAVREVSVVVSDPWSFVDGQGSNTFTATVRATDGEKLLLLLSGQHYVASPKSSEGYGLIPVTDDQSREEPPWGSNQWRGHPAALLAELREV
jgi:hypothetical protein